MKPLEFRTSSFRFRDESQFQPRCEDNRVHRVAPLLRFVTFEVIVMNECIQKEAIYANWQGRRN